MNNLLSDTGLPWWFFFITCSLALLTGHMLRRWWKHRGHLQQLREKEELRQEKKQIKYEQRQRKKALRRRK